MPLEGPVGRPGLASASAGCDDPAATMVAGPAGPGEGMAVDTRRFAVLEHRWDGVHWDFLVEDGPTLRAWAIDAPIVEGADLPARALAAHRRIYLDYEGEVSGGRGSVRRWDRGECTVVEWGEGLVRLELRGAQLVGWAEFRGAGAEGPRGWRARFGKLS